MSNVNSTRIKKTADNKRFYSVRETKVEYVSKEQYSLRLLKTEFAFC